MGVQDQPRIIKADGASLLKKYEVYADVKQVKTCDPNKTNGSWLPRGLAGSAAGDLS